MVTVLWAYIFFSTKVLIGDGKETSQIILFHMFDHIQGGPVGSFFLPGPQSRPSSGYYSLVFLKLSI